MSYVEPVPGGTIGRTDQGVDISGPPGTRILAIARERLVKVIPNWYQGQPFYVFQILNSRGKPTGRYDYVAEQIRSRLRVGQTVQAGQQIGTIAPSGTGLELGWATPSGETEAMATTGYTEGQATPAGSSYRSQVIARGSKSPRRGGGSSGPQSYWANLWIQEGGPPQVANTMAAIVMAESSGRMNAVDHDSNGTTDYGPFQVNSVHGFNPHLLMTDPAYTTRAAIKVYKSQGLQAWSTYNNGDYKDYLNGGTSAPKYGGSRPGGSNSPDPTTQLKDYVNLRDTTRTAPPGTKNPFQWWWASFSGNWDTLHQDASS